jgi:hypothetical protein
MEKTGDIVYSEKRYIETGIISLSFQDSRKGINETKSFNYITAFHRHEIHP